MTRPPEYAPYGGHEIDGVPPFQSPIAFEFDPQVNVFIGPNATGKSTILKLLREEIPSLYRFKDGGSTTIRNLPKVYLPPVRDVAPAELIEYGNPPDQIAPEDVDVSDDFLRNLVYEAALNKMEDWDYRRSSKYDEPLDDSFWEDIGEYIKGVINHALRGLGPLRVASYSELLDRSYQIKDFYPEEFWHFIESKSDSDMERLERLARRELLMVEGRGFLLNGADPYTRFPAVRVKMALDLLRQSERQVVREMWVNVQKVAVACCRDICPEVFRGVSVYRDQKYVDGELVDEKPYPGMGFIPARKSENDSIHMGVTSTGTQGLWWWINWLTLQLAYTALVSSRSSRDSFHQQNAILLIDEIENHLHPTWQRRVIPALLKHFPGLQIFATTHSPFVVAGLKRGQIHRLYHEGGVIKTDKLTEEEKEQRITGWTVEEILREFMEVDDPTDEATATAAATLRWLRGRYPSDRDVTAAQWVQEFIDHLEANPERTRDETAALGWLTEQQQKESEALSGINVAEWRVRILGELRAQVSVALGDGGPFAAPPEPYSDQFWDLLADDEDDEDASQYLEEEG